MPIDKKEALFGKKINKPGHKTPLILSKRISIALELSRKKSKGYKS